MAVAKRWIAITFGGLGFMASMLQGVFIFVLYLDKAIENIGVEQVREYFAYLLLGVLVGLSTMTIGLRKILKERESDE